MHIRLRILACAVALIAALAQPAAAERRVALVIGNSAYQHTNVLPNPRNDAADIGSALRRLGFEVIDGGLDLDKRALERKMREFTGRLAGSDVALFFYAGHAVQVGGQNLLMPTDAKLAAEADIDFETIPLALVLRHMEREAKTSLVFLDACRDNPLTKNLSRRATRSIFIAQGLASVEAGIGTLIGFSTQPGNVAIDGEGRNSPYAAALLKHIESTGLDIGTVMMHVRNEVLQNTQRRQVPWEHSSLTRPFQFNLSSANAPAPGVPPPAVAPQAPNEQAVAWATIKDTTSIPVLEAFWKRYPSGIYADMARARIEELRQMRVDEANSANREREMRERNLREQQERETRLQEAREASERQAREKEAREREAREREVRERQQRVAIAPPQLAPAVAAPLARPDAHGVISAWIERDFLGDNIAYAATVDWYDQGTISREAVLKDRAKYLARWPERTFALVPGTIQITGSGPNRYVVTFEHTYAVRSEARKTKGSGKSRIMLDVEMIDGTPHVARQKEITSR